jgi:uncharacterized protein (TIGR02145 family)
MNIIYRNIYFKLTFFVLLFLINSCKKDELPREVKIKTTDVTEIMATTARANGDVIDLGEGIDDHGHCWSISPNPVITDTRSSLGNSNIPGTFKSDLINLNPGQTYYVRAYAKSGDKIIYGESKNFTTQTGRATINTIEASSITINSATSGGEIISANGSTVLSRGVCWDTLSTVTMRKKSGFTQAGTGTGQYTANLTSLVPGETYYIKAWAKTEIDTTYADAKSFRTICGVSSITTSALSSITANTAVSGGVITGDGGPSITSRGVCWNTSQNPTTANTKTIDASGTGTYSSNITGLLPGQTYYVRAYATNSIRTFYGNSETFTAKNGIATLTTTVPSSITATTAISGGNIADDGGATITERGICWSLTQNPTTSNSKVANGSGTGTYSCSITGLQGGKTYYVRAYAINSITTSYGDQQTCPTPAGLATVSTADPSAITSATAASGGNVTDEGGTAVTVRGVCWSTSVNPTVSLTTKTTDGSGPGTFTSSITGLTPGTAYYVRAYATNSTGTAYGIQKPFTAAAVIPTVTTTDVSNILVPNATGGGNVTSSGGASVTVRGVCWNTSPGPTTSNSKTTNGTGTGSFTSTLIDLQSGMTYYVRAYATNSVGTGYGEEKMFTMGIAPTVITTDVTGITSTTSSSGGNVTASGGSAVSARGVCWSTTTNPTITNSKTSDGAGTGVYTSSLSSLIPGTTYYVRAYATNSSGTGYGAEKSFVTLIIPSVTTADISDITATTATGGGDVTFAGNTTVTARGVCWSTNQNPTTSNSKTNDGSGTGPYTSSLTGLVPNTTYYVRAYATNSVGTAYGTQKSFKTGMTLPTISTTNVTSITAVAASSGGVISSDGGSAITGRGVCWSTNINPTLSDNQTFDGTGTGTFISSITGLSRNTSYYVRAFATNSEGTAYGPNQSFTTNIGLPVLTTTDVLNIQSFTAVCGGNITLDYGLPITSKGVCWGTSITPMLSGSHTSDGAGSGTFISSITGLSAEQTYYVRAYATNSAGTTYGNTLSFKTLKSTQVSDYDGNVYNNVVIGTQIWMKENLRTTKYNDNSQIAYGNYSWYNGIDDRFGAIYDIYSVNTGKLCPTNWHVPTLSDWQTLITYVGGYLGGGKLKEAGLVYWESPNTGATNETGFSGLPGGFRYTDSGYYYWGKAGYWWSSTTRNSDELYATRLFYDSEFVDTPWYSGYGCSVRCIKNQLK